MKEVFVKKIDNARRIGKDLGRSNWTKYGGASLIFMNLKTS
jgi:hypothetical protein